MTEGGDRDDSEEFARRGRDTLAVIESIARVGCRIDVSPAGLRDAPLDAIRIVDAARDAAGDWWPLIRDCARAGTRPYIRDDDRTRYEPREWKRRRAGRGGGFEGRSELLSVDTMRRPGSGLWFRYEVRWTPVYCINPPSELERERDRYRRWWEALHAARRLLLDGPALEHWNITGALPPAAPWLAGRRSAQPRGQR